MTIEADEVDMAVVRSVPILWVPAGTLAFQPSRNTVMTALRERARREHTIIDLDWRPALWHGDEAAASAAVAEVLPLATMAIGNREECRIAVGTADPHEAADRLLGLGLSAAIVKMGGDGVMVATADGVRTQVPPRRVEVVCGLGAGDAFGGAICHGLLSGWSLVRCAEAGNAAGAIVASRLMCADDMPTEADIEGMLSNGAV